MSRHRPRLGWFRALSRYYRDPSASVAGKLVMFFALIYVVVPIDLIPDVPFVGWLDDIGVMGLASAWLGRVVARYRVLPDAPEFAHVVPDLPKRRPFSLTP
jgi:uncharacterized membrane protein YkvA (DUF1232 family)